MIFADAKRATDIFRRREAGETFKEIGETHRIGKQRCREIWVKVTRIKGQDPFRHMTNDEFCEDISSGGPAWRSYTDGVGEKRKQRKLAQERK